MAFCPVERLLLCLGLARSRAPRFRTSHNPVGWITSIVNSMLITPGPSPKPGPNLQWAVVATATKMPWLKP